MKKEYTKPTIDVKEFNVDATIADLDLSGNATLGPVGGSNSGQGVNWDDE